MRVVAVLLPHPPSLFLFYLSYFYLNSGIAEAEPKLLRDKSALLLLHGSHVSIISKLGSST